MTRFSKTVTIGDTLFVFVGQGESDRAASDARIQELIDSLKPNGDSLRFQDGTCIFVEDVVCFDSTKAGSDCWTWDKTGNRAKHARTRITISNGERTETVLAYVYKAI